MDAETKVGIEDHEQESRRWDCMWSTKQRSSSIA